MSANDRSYDPSHEEIERWELDQEDAVWRASRERSRKASAEVEQAIDLSIRENRTVALAGGADDYDLLFNCLMVEADDSVDLNYDMSPDATLDVAEFWGEKWRVDLWTPLPLKSGE